ncbi:MAG TPA: glutamine synthetase [Trueperaceae bacterium]|nr:glutamine synthetase [Trueperaceae bacterium]
MDKPKGMLSLEELANLVHADEIDTVIVAFSDHFGRMMGKRFDADFFLQDAAKNGTHACDYILTTDMEMEPVAGYKFANWQLGYGDFHLVPDLNTLRLASWQEKTALVLCNLFDKNHSHIEIAPRSILLKQLKILAEMGFSALAATELEYYLLEESYKEAHNAHYMDLEPVGWYLEDYNIMQGSREEFFNAAARRHLKNSGIPVETSKGEFGLGQHELNVRYSDCLTMADNHVIYKQALKEIADSLGISVTFMAKYQSGQAGSSSHIHISLWQNENNAFAGNKAIGTIKASETFEYFLGGLIKHAPEFMVFYAPTINSYKRFEDGSWAPTRLAWSYDNRTAGFRVVGKGKSLRIECRIPGADVNPYLALAALLASGIDGIKNKIKAPDIFVGDIYAAQNLARVPYSLKEAIPLFENSDFVKQCLGDSVVEHYSHFFKTEQAAFEKYVTNWELKRYFERI